MSIIWRGSKLTYDWCYENLRALVADSRGASVFGVIIGGIG